VTGATATSTPVATQAALLERLQAQPALAGVLVRWGLLATLPRERERIYLLGTAEYERAAVSGAHRVRQETYSLRGIIEVYDLDTGGPEQAATRAWALLDIADEALREDPDLASGRYDGTFRVLIDEVLPATDGWIARLGFRIGFFHNR
jgi:hypothetical protein